MKNLVIDAKTVQAIQGLIIDELARAEAKHPDWPDDPVHAAAIVGEEQGELTRAALKYFYEGEGTTLRKRNAMRREAIETATTAYRFLAGLMTTDGYAFQVDYEVVDNGGAREEDG